MTATSSIPIPAANTADVGLVGLAVMGANLALNMADHGFRVAVYNRTASVTEQFIKDNPPAVIGPGGALVPAADLKAFVASIKRPRRIVILVKAGPGTDAVIDGLAPLLEKGDCIIDGGNAEWTDTVRRERALAERGLLFVGSGVSGGEAGARFGPSLMPGGTREAWELIKPVWTKIAAKVDPKTGKQYLDAARGGPRRAGAIACTAYIGPGGARALCQDGAQRDRVRGHATDLRAYHFLREVLALDVGAIAAIFAEWNRGDLDSFLIEITADILRQKDPVTGKPFVDVVLDAAGQKGTGKWTINSALDLGVPVATMAEAVFARNIGPEGGTRRREQGAARAEGGRALALDGLGGVQLGRGGAGCAVLLEDLLVCAGLCAHAGREPRERMETEPRRDRVDLPRRVHHPGAVPAEDHRGLCAPGRPAQPAAR